MDTVERWHLGVPSASVVARGHLLIGPVSAAILSCVTDALPDDLVVPAAEIAVHLPIPRFPEGVADWAFPPETVHGSWQAVTATAFSGLVGLGYRHLGSWAHVQIGVSVRALAGHGCTVWVCRYRDAVASVIVTAGEATDIQGFYSDVVRGNDAASAVWGGFAAQPPHLPALAQRFVRAAGDLLAAETVDVDQLRDRLREDAEDLTRTARTASTIASAGRRVGIGQFRQALRALEPYESELDADGQAILAAARQGAATQAPALIRGNMSDADWLRARAEHLAAVHAHVKSTFAARTADPTAMEAWQAATGDFHEAVTLMYDGVDASIRAARAGDSAAVDDLITFVEVDPWCFRSGYAKERIYHILRRVDLSDGQKARLRRALLRIVDSGDRREFHDTLRLARHLADEQFVEDLRLRASSSDDVHLCRRVLWILETLPGGLDGLEAAIRAVVLAGAADADWFRASSWVTRFAARIVDESLTAEVLALARDSDPARQKVGLRLLWPVVGASIPPDLQDALRPLVAEGVRRRGPATDVVESLAVQTDSESLRQQLRDLIAGEDRQPKMRARWALMAAERAHGEKAPSP